MTFDIKPWKEIEKNYDDTILLGNGASIAVSDKFRYESLLDQSSLSADTKKLFDLFKTKDFERVLRIVWQASNVNRLLGISDEKTHQTYVNLRDGLIQTVGDIHPKYGEVEEHLPSIYQFLKRFKIVISLSYDLDSVVTRF